MKTALREGLVEINATISTFATPSLEKRAAALYDRAGSDAVTRLFEPFRLGDSARGRRLEEAVDPGLAAFSLAF